MNEPNETYFESGILFGHFHTDSELRCAQGHAFWNYPNGVRLIEGFYTNGVRSGRWIDFAEDCSILSVTEFGDAEYTKPAATPQISDANISPETTILLAEEYGYRHWLWLPDRPLPDVLIWWRNVFSIEPWFYGPEPLPGVLLEAAEFVDHWRSLRDSGSYFCGHFHDDDDSHLENLAGELIHHRGYNFTNQHSTT